MTRIIRAPRSPDDRQRADNPERPRVLPAARLLALQKAEEELRAAHRQAGGIVERAQREAEELRRTAIAESRITAAALLARAEHAAADIVDGARHDLTALAVRIAEKILGAELRLHPEGVSSIVEQCLRAVTGARQVRLRINPADQPQLEAALPRLEAAGVRLALSPDLEISPGGCVLETDLGEVDGRLEVQLARLAEALR